MTQQITDWIGRRQTAENRLRPAPARFLEATLGRAPSLAEGDPLPPLWHWLYFLEAVQAGELGRDGHPQKGRFLPPVDLPRRMWAGGRFEFLRPLQLGQQVQRVSTIRDVVEKTGRSGRLCFVTVRHEILANGETALTEEHDIVYRDDPEPGSPAPEPPAAPYDPELSEEFAPTEVMLFRYSALTFNGHRIHYDVDYARAVEGYEGLVVHGPLTATLLVDLACRTSGATPRRFGFRARAPLAGLRPFRIEGRREGSEIALWARRHDGVLAMSARAEF